ncbi:MAG: DUF1573 domain-containing protein [Bacteroidales bacterium]|jgi:hypothetical protein|nr:DUF1573 domain-containing protein [Bacteroidales bacterium]
MKLRFFLLILIVLNSCKEDKKVSEANRIVEEWVGKTIQFPTIKSFSIGTEDSPLLLSGISKDYKILLYVDSTGCTSCRLGLETLGRWETYIKEFWEKIDFLFYFRPKNKGELLSILKNAQFSHPVYIDEQGELNKLNKLPANQTFQCFLLDKDNKVILIGNPANNPKIWELYKEVITGEVSTMPLVTTAEPQQTEIEIKNLQLGKTSEAVFVLKNTGSQPLVIQMVNASCGCTVPEWEKHPIAPGKSTEIRIRITPEEKGYFNKTVTVYSNTETGRIVLKVLGVVNEK